MMDFIWSALPWVALGITVALVLTNLSSKKEKLNTTEGENSFWDGNIGDKDKKEEDNMTMGMCMGMGLGIVVGSSLTNTFGNIALTYGICFGILFGMLIGMSTKKK